MSRPIDTAMIQDRPDKDYLRRRWIDRVVDTAIPEGRPVYITLCGAEGHEIGMLIEAGVLQKTESGAIADSSRVVAIEASSLAVLRLQELYPALKIVQAPVKSLLQGDGLDSWPTKKNRGDCVADVINLDYQGSLKATADDGHLEFADLHSVRKLLYLHRQEGVHDWTLFLTFRASIDWPDEVCEAVRCYLLDNFNLEPEFESACQEHMGSELIQILRDGPAAALRDLDSEAQQCLIMALVPKKVAWMATDYGFRVETEWNTRYGHAGPGDRAAMVSWSFRFVVDGAVTTSPTAAYKGALLGVHTSCETLLPDGTFAP